MLLTVVVVDVVLWRGGLKTHVHYVRWPCRFAERNSKSAAIHYRWNRLRNIAERHDAAAMLKVRLKMMQSRYRLTAAGIKGRLAKDPRADGIQVVLARMRAIGSVHVRHAADGLRLLLACRLCARGPCCRTVVDSHLIDIPP